MLSRNVLLLARSAAKKGSRAKLSKAASSAIAAKQISVLGTVPNAQPGSVNILTTIPPVPGMPSLRAINTKTAVPKASKAKKVSLKKKRRSSKRKAAAPAAPAKAKAKSGAKRVRKASKKVKKTAAKAGAAPKKLAKKKSVKRTKKAAKKH